MNQQTNLPVYRHFRAFTADAEGEVEDVTLRIEIGTDSRHLRFSWACCSVEQQFSRKEGRRIADQTRDTRYGVIEYDPSLSFIENIVQCAHFITLHGDPGQLTQEEFSSYMWREHRRMIEAVLILIDPQQEYNHRKHNRGGPNFLLRVVKRLTASA